MFQTVSPPSKQPQSLTQKPPSHNSMPTFLLCQRLPRNVSFSNSSTKPTTVVEALIPHPPLLPQTSTNGLGRLGRVLRRWLEGGTTTTAAGVVDTQRRCRTWCGLRRKCHLLLARWEEWIFLVNGNFLLMNGNFHFGVCMANMTGITSNAMASNALDLYINTIHAITACLCHILLLYYFKTALLICFCKVFILISVSM